MTLFPRNDQVCKSSVSLGKRVDQYEWTTASSTSENALLFERISHVLGFPRILYQESASKFT